MNDQRKSPGRPWKKGQSGNPKGRPKVLPELLNVKPLTNEEVKRVLGKYCRLDLELIDAALEDPRVPIYEKIVAKILKLALEQGDYYRLNFIFNRTIGKVTDKLEMELPEPIIIKKRSGEEVHLVARNKNDCNEIIDCDSIDDLDEDVRDESDNT